MHGVGDGASRGALRAALWRDEASRRFARGVESCRQADIYIYIYIYRERERDIERDIHMYVHIYIYRERDIYIYIYTYIILDVVPDIS